MRYLIASLAVLFIAASAPAQPLPTAKPDRFERTNPDPATSGGDLNVVYEDPAAAGTTIEVEAHDLLNSADKRSVAVTLGPDGAGSKTMVVPFGWGGVVLTAPNSADHTVPIAGDSAPVPDPAEGEDGEVEAHLAPVTTEA